VSGFVAATRGAPDATPHSLISSSLPPDNLGAISIPWNCAAVLSACAPYAAFIPRAPQIAAIESEKTQRMETSA
jgi:hypothetical protein